jgi:hypothetical protein
MSQLCAPRFAALILRVPAQFPGQNDLARRVIGTISHADKMATICGPSAAADLMVAVAGMAFHAAAAETYRWQCEAARIVLAMIAHAHSMGRTVSEAREEMLEVVRPLVDQPLAATQDELNSLSAQQATAMARIREISHAAIMNRIAQAGR